MSAVKALRAGPMKTKVAPRISVSMNIRGKLTRSSSSRTPVSASITAPDPWPQMIRRLRLTRSAITPPQGEPISIEMPVPIETSPTAELVPPRS